MSFAVSLKSCRAKLKQARRHRATLIAEVDKHFSVSTNRPTLVAELDPISGDHIFRVASVPPIAELQEILAVTVGDAVHNLRSALDHLAFQLACVNTNGVLKHEKSVQFPIGDTAKEYADQADRYLKEVHQTHRKMVDSYQPYYGNVGRPDNYSGPYIHQLSLLRDLSNSDKHRLLNTVLIIPAGANFTLPAGIEVAKFEPKSLDEMRRTGPFRNAGDRLEVGVEVFRHRLSGQNVIPRISNVGNVIPHIAFAENRSLIPALERLESFVELVVNDFGAKLGV